MLVLQSGKDFFLCVDGLTCLYFGRWFSCFGGFQILHTMLLDHATIFCWECCNDLEGTNGEEGRGGDKGITTDFTQHHFNFFFAFKQFHNASVTCRTLVRFSLFSVRQMKLTKGKSGLPSPNEINVYLSPWQPTIANFLHLTLLIFLLTLSLFFHNNVALYLGEIAFAIISPQFNLP